MLLLLFVMVLAEQTSNAMLFSVRKRKMGSEEGEEKLVWTGMAWIIEQSKSKKG